MVSYNIGFLFQTLMPQGICGHSVRLAAGCLSRAKAPQLVGRGVMLISILIGDLSASQLYLVVASGSKSVAKENPETSG